MRFFGFITLAAMFFSAVSCSAVTLRPASEYRAYQTEYTGTPDDSVPVVITASKTLDTFSSPPDVRQSVTSETEIMNMSGKILDYSDERISLLSTSGSRLEFKINSLTEITGSGLMTGGAVTVYFYGGTDDPAVKIETVDSPSLTRAREIMSKMSVEDKIAQMFIVRCPADSVEAVEALNGFKFGGYVLSSKNIDNQTIDSLTQIIENYQSASQIKMFIAVDEESGSGTQLNSFTELSAEKFKSLRELFSEGGLEAVAAETEEKAVLLSSLGFNLNLSPVCDISQNESHYLGEDAETTSLFVKQAVEIAKKSGIGSALRHFPGYVSNGTNAAIVTDNRTYDTFTAVDFLPFMDAIEAGAGGVIMSHNIVKCMDEDYPASLSKKVNDILRYDLNFNGVIITEDLSMSAIMIYTNGDDAAVAAIEAGNDLISCADFAIQFPAVVKAVSSGKISQKQINESVMRILAWKLDLGIIK